MDFAQILIVFSSVVTYLFFNSGSTEDIQNGRLKEPTFPMGWYCDNAQTYGQENLDDLSKKVEGNPAVLDDRLTESR